MKLLVKNKSDFQKRIDRRYPCEKSIVLRYHDCLAFEHHDEDKDRELKDWLEKTSIREGSRILPLLIYKGVKIYILDETSLMHTHTLKSIDGCISLARAKLAGLDRVVFESGGNTGTALTVYGQKLGFETFFFIPEDNLSLLDSRLFKSSRAHLISVKSPGLVKEAAQAFAQKKGLLRIPRVEWRHEASLCRGFSILEYIFENGSFDWLAQTISAAFGPIGIYAILANFKELRSRLPRFLGIQQEANCPFYNAWKQKRPRPQKEKIVSTANLLTRVMYDVRPHTYGAFEGFIRMLKQSAGAITTLNHLEFKRFMEYKFDAQGIVGLLKEKGIEITLKNNEVIEKTGLMALAGALKEIESGRISRGQKVLCCLTSGISRADGKSEPEYRISCLQDAYKYSKSVSG